MCWKSNYVPIKKIAEEDILIFKVMRNNFISMYYYKHYALNTLYDVILEKPYYHPLPNLFDKICDFYTIHQGFHSYDRKEVSLHTRAAFFNECIIDICYGLKKLDSIVCYGLKKPDSIIYYSDSFVSELFIKVDGIIPKGAEYYKNEVGEYVSNKIILTNES